MRGSLDARYWENRRIGYDIGIGLGLTQTNPSARFIGAFHFEEMFAIKENAANIFYANAEISPGFLSASGNSPFFMSLAGGFGLEHAVMGISTLSLYSEWDPISVNLYSPAEGGATNVNSSLFGGILNFGTGFRYYF